MKTISRKQAIEAIESKGIEASLRIGKSGLTAKQRKFAEGIVLEGLTGADSYRKAYNAKGKPKTVGNHASALKQHDGIKREMELLEVHKQAVASHSAESLRALCVSTLVDVATNSDRDAVRVAAVRVLGSVVGVDAYRETKRIETVKDSSEIRDQILGQLKTMMLGTDSAVDVDANDLLSELTGSDPTHAPPPETENGTPTDHEHTIPHEQSQSFSDEEEQSPQFTEDPPSLRNCRPPRGIYF